MHRCARIDAWESFSDRLWRQERSKAVTKVVRHRESSVYVGHINLAESMNGTGEHFIKLVEGLDRQGIRQHVLVRNRSLARRLAVCDNVTVGPVVKTPVMAYCLMPSVSVAHAHDVKSGHAALLMTLTRSTPYVVTRRSTDAPGRNPITRAIYRRAASLICSTDAAAAKMLETDLSVLIDVIRDISYAASDDPETDGNRIAAAHARIYRRAIDSWRVPALLL